MSEPFDPSGILSPDDILVTYMAPYEKRDGEWRGSRKKGWYAYYDKSNPTVPHIVMSVKAMDLAFGEGEWSFSCDSESED